ncbi:vWA domain-containing protein [Halococcoides cellulosivorans]|nr:vWA domain-containing protein [Halococcoides cellulosivorans]
MSLRTDRPIPDNVDGDRRSRRRMLWLAVSVAVLTALVFALMALPVTAASETTALANAADDANETQIDVVFVFDRSESTNENRYHMAQEIGRLDDTLDAHGVDDRYGLVTYNATARVEQNMTASFGAIERAMHYPVGGNRENASDAILTATDLDLRANATTLVVVMTDEDDDSSNATRAAAIDALGDAHLVAISPAGPATSSCAVHSPPCDDRTDNELREVANRTDGEWIDVNEPATRIVDRLGETLDAAFADAAERSIDRPEFEVTDTRANRTTVQIGSAVGVTVTVANTGSAAGEYTAYLSHSGRLVDEQRVEIPADGEQTLTLAHAFDQSGTYELFVTHEPAVTVTVLPGASETPPTTTAADGAAGTTDAPAARASFVPGVALVAALIAIVALAAVTVRAV